MTKARGQGKTPQNSGVRHLVVISDTHVGSTTAICPSEVYLDDGGIYYPSTLQKRLGEWWKIFWDQWVPYVTFGEPYAVVVNGDLIDGVHHGITGLFSHSLEDQERSAIDLFTPIVSEPKCAAFYMIRGTEAHSGASGQSEERIARELSAVGAGNLFSRWEMWIQLGSYLVHFAHHIGTSRRFHTEATALMGELADVFTAAGRWGTRAPDICVRSHRHSHCMVKAPIANGSAYVVTTPAWQLQTPFTYKMRPMVLPQIGGLCLSYDEAGVYLRDKIWTPDPPKTVDVSQLVESTKVPTSPTKKSVTQSKRRSKKSTRSYNRKKKR